jgi:hypothetical protein
LARVSAEDRAGSGRDREPDDAIAHAALADHAAAIFLETPIIVKSSDRAPMRIEYN